MTDIAMERAILRQQGLNIINREVWDAVQDYTSDRTVYTPVEGFVLHVSVTDDTGNEHADMRTIERIGQQRFGIGCSYNAAVFKTGNLYEAQPLTRRGAHTVDDKNIGYKSTGASRSMNYWWRALVLPQQPDDEVTDAQIDQAARWAAAQIRSGYARQDFTWIGHRDVAWKDCPGDNGYSRLPELRALTGYYAQNGLVSHVELEEDTMTMIKNRKNGYTMLAYGGKLIAVTGPENWSSAEGNMPHIVLDDDEYNRLIKYFGPVLK